MKPPLQLAALALVLSTINTQLSTVLAQGVLTPPGAPAAGMKTLDQMYAKLDPRTAITNTSSLVTITQPGSYYLTHNLSVSSGDGIDINTNGVTVDLNGFTIASAAASATGTGILLSSGLWNISILNGFIKGGVTDNGFGVYSGSGFGNGISYAGNQPVNTRISGVAVAGVLNYGIWLSGGYSTVVDGCTVATAGQYGIVASTIKSCVVLDCGTIGIDGDQVSDSRGDSNSNHGLLATTALNCVGNSNSGYGLYATTALNCYGISGSGGGLVSQTAQNCYGYSTSGYGLYAETALNCYGIAYGSSEGLRGTMATGCYGYSASGTGLSVTRGNFCFGSSVSVTTKYNMP